jgi:aquaporin Z
MNPALTFTYWRLGKIEGRDALFYFAAQFAGGLAGVAACALAIGEWARAPEVRYAATIPGPGYTAAVAFGAELLISFVLMSVVLLASNHRRWASWTGCCCGALVALFISVESPISGMSMNPARTIGSAVPAHVYTALWVYLVAPLAGMLGAAECYVRARGAEAVLCCKLHHAPGVECIFRCNFFT